MSRRSPLGLMRAQALGLRTVAEGIETSEQLDVVTQLGCDAGQGFFLARPREPQDLVDLLG